MLIDLKKCFYLLIIVLFFLPTINAGSLGMSPSSFKFNFEPGLEERVTIRVASSDMTQPISIYVSGDLSEYVNISSKNFTGVGVLEVRIKLPEKLDRPGNHRIIIGSREEKEISAGGIISGVSAIQVPIDIFVPYPGKYAEAEFSVDNANENEDVPYTLTISNLGKESINFNYEIEVFSDSNKSIFSFKNGSSLSPNVKMTIKDDFESSIFKPGNYYAVAKINYEREIVLNDSFVVGTFFLNITDYDYEFISGKINPFKLYASSFWNSEINEVYAEISVTDLGIIKSYFKSPVYSFSPMEEKQIGGYIDATNITPGRYVGNIVLNYGDKKTSKLVAFYFIKPETTKTERLLYLAAGIIVLFIVVIIALFVKLYLVRRSRRKNEKR